MATGVKYYSQPETSLSGCFPVRGLIKSFAVEGDGSWLVAYRTEQRRRFKAVLCGKPRTYSRIKRERKKTQKKHDVLAKQHSDDFSDNDEQPVLDGFLLMKHCHIEDPSDVCSINISGLKLTDTKQSDFHMFDNVVHINAGENYLPFDAFQSFPALRELEVPLNGLRSLKIQHNDFPLLEVLDLSYNNLSHDDVLTLGLLPNLQILQLTGNNFRNLPQDMAEPYISHDKKVKKNRYSRLEILLLDDNKLEDITVFSALARLPKLRHINMEKNQIVHVPHLKCVEGHIFIYNVSEPNTKGQHSSSHKSSRSVISQNAGPETVNDLPQQSPSHHEEVSLVETIMDTSESPMSGKKVTLETERQGECAGAGADVQRSNEDQNYHALLTDDFSLGDLSARIHEIVKEETDENLKEANEDVELKTLSPFPELLSLNLAHNKIEVESALLAVATWPALVHLIIHSNPLTTQHSGDPPLLKRFLSDRLGIRLQRQVRVRSGKHHIEMQQNKARKVSDKIPKVPRSTIEERLAIDAPTPKPVLLDSDAWMLGESLSDFDDKTSRRKPESLELERELSVNQSAIRHDENRHKWPGGMVNEEENAGYDNKKLQKPGTAYSDTFYMTQLEEEVLTAADKQDQKTKTDRYDGYEIFLDIDHEKDLDAELPKDIQGNIRALKYTLEHPLVYRDPSVDLDRVKRKVSEFRRVPIPPAQPYKSHQEHVDDVLENLRTLKTVEEEKLADVLRHPRKFSKKFPDASNLLGQIQRRYNAVRANSIKPTQEAKNVVDEAFKVLNKHR